MAKTETNVSTLKINRGTYAKVQENLSSITENELIITSDKNVPVPTTNDNGKAVVVNASGEYELGNAGMSQSDADARYLKLSGGTMGTTANIKFANGNGIWNGNGTLIYGTYNGSATYVGDSGITTALVLNTKGNQNITHLVGGTTTYDILDTANTSANPTLAGTESALTGLKVNGTSYKVESGLPTTGGTMTGDITMTNDSSIKVDTIKALSKGTEYSGCVKISNGTIPIVLDYDSAVIHKKGSNNLLKMYDESNGVGYTTTLPTADNTKGGIIIVETNSDPATRYNGYLYIVKSSSASNNGNGGGGAN